MNWSDGKGSSSPHSVYLEACTRVASSVGTDLATTDVVAGNPLTLRHPTGCSHAHTKAYASRGRLVFFQYGSPNLLLGQCPLSAIYFGLSRRESNARYPKRVFSPRHFVEICSINTNGSVKSGLHSLTPGTFLSLFFTFHWQFPSASVSYSYCIFAGNLTRYVPTFPLRLTRSDASWVECGAPYPCF